MKAPSPKPAAPKASASKPAASKIAPAKPAASHKDPLGEPFEIVHAEFTAAAGLKSSLPDHGLEIAFAGRSNVGKSSLINGLTGRKNLVRVGATPGVTRTLTQFAARTRAGATFALVDLPGYGFAQRSKAERREWADLIEGYLRDRPQLVAVVLLVDARRGVEEEDRALIEFVMTPGETERPVPELLLVATKIDKVSKSAQLAAVNAVMAPGGTRAIAWSSVTGQGRADLARRISLALERAGARR